MELQIPILDEHFIADRTTPREMDLLWANGWRHFGSLFVRYSVSPENEEWQVVQPLRIALERSPIAKRHRRILERNADLDVRFEPPVVNEERHHLFHRHKQRFTRNVPDSLTDFLGAAPGVCPSEMVEVAAYAQGRLVATAYLDIGAEAASSVYACFCPAEARRGLGIATMLWEMDYARRRGCRYYYPGYAFHQPSSLDYKKQFPGTEWFDWNGQWRELL